jgi:PDZ domain-containing protein
VSQPTHDVLHGAGDGDAGDAEGQRTRRGRNPANRPGLLAGVLLTATFVAIAIAAALTFVGLPYVVMSPGPATNILGKVDGKALLSIEGAPTYPTSGTLDFTTVSVDGGPGVRVTVYDLAQAWLSGSQEILPEEQVFPPEQTEKDAQEEGAAEMAGSQSVATATALRAIGKKVPEMVVVAGVPDSSPSKGIFQPDDVLVTVDGDPASSSDAVRAAVQRHQPGDTFPVVVRRDGKEQAVTAKTTEADGRTVMGVGLRLDYDLPVDVTLRTGSVGGPSAGLMFSLAIYDALTPGELTGGKKIAGTGTLDDAGTVGPIGGIRQKLIGARRAGADFFLAPADNCADIGEAVPDGLRVVKVGSFDEGRKAVQAIGDGKAESLPTCG